MRPFQVAGYPRDLLHRHNGLGTREFPEKCRQNGAILSTKLQAFWGICGILLPVPETFGLLQLHFLANMPASDSDA